MTLGEYVKNYRKEHGLSMQAFGDRCGLSRAYISILEKGINPTTGKNFAPTVDTLNRIAEAIGVTIDGLLPLLDDNQTIAVNTPSQSQFQLTDDEKTLVTKYRKLTPTNKTVIDSNIDFMLYQQELDVQKEWLCSAS